MMAAGALNCQTFAGLVGGYTYHVARLGGEYNELLLGQNRRYTRIIFRGNLKNLHLVVGLEDVNTLVDAGDIKK